MKTRRVLQVWKNSLWLFSVSITHNSKIKELSDGNRVMETELSFGQTTFLLWVPPFLSYELWKLRIELSNLVGQTASQTLSHSPLNKLIERPHFLGTSEIGVKIESVLKNFWYLVLKFIIPRYTLLFLNSEIYIIHVIKCE